MKVVNHLKMHRLILIFLLIEIISCQNLYPSTPIEFRGLWCISQWNNNQQNYSRQLGQAFFYNNETFTLNFLDNIQFTWINHFVGIHKTDNQGTYRILTDTTRGPAIYVNKISCVWRRQISNGDVLWGRQSNGSCTPLFETDISAESIRYTRNALNCYYIDDENTNEILSNTQYERELIEYDKSLRNSKQQSIVFYGSSSIRLWSTLINDFSNARFNVINRGFGGSTLKQCYQQFKRIILPLDPRLLILYAGENDLSTDQTPLSVQSIFRQLIPTIRRFFPSLPIVFISIKPCPGRLNKLIEQNITNHLIQEDIKNMDNIYYLDIFNEMLTADGKPRSELFGSDNVHMNEKGYEIWTRAVQNYLRTNGFISKGLINCKLSFVIFTLNLFVFFIGIK